MSAQTNVGGEVWLRELSVGMHGRWTLRSYLVAFAIALTAPLLTGEIVALYHFAGVERFRLGMQVDDANEDIFERVGRALRTRVAILEGVAAMLATAPEPGRRLEDQFRALARASGVHFALLDRDGGRGLDTRRPPGASEGEPDLEVVYNVMVTKHAYVSNLHFDRTDKRQPAVGAAQCRDRRLLAQAAAPVGASGPGGPPPFAHAAPDRAHSPLPHSAAGAGGPAGYRHAAGSAAGCRGPISPGGGVEGACADPAIRCCSTGAIGRSGKRHHLHGEHAAADRARRSLS